MCSPSYKKSDSLIKLLVYGFGTTRIVLGVSLVQASDHYLLRGIAAIVAGTAAIVAAKALRPWHGNRLGSALIVTGLATPSVRKVTGLITACRPG